MKKDRRAEINNMVEFIATNYNYGDIIGFPQLERLTGLSRDELGFAYLVLAVKRELIEYGCILTAVIGEGYRILKPNEVPKEVYKKYVRQGVNKFRLGLKIMENVDQTLLTEEEKAEFLAMNKIVDNLNRSSENHLLEAQVLLGDVKRKELSK